MAGQLQDNAKNPAEKPGFFVYFSPHDAANKFGRGEHTAEKKNMQAMTLEIPELVGKRCLRIAEAATYLGLGRSKIYELIASGRLRSVKFDSSRRIPVAAIEAFLSQHDGSGVL